MTQPSARGDPSQVVRVAGGFGNPRRRRLLDAAREVTDEAVIGTGPTGITALEPLVLVTADGKTAFLPQPDEMEVQETLRAVNDVRAPENAFEHVTHNGDTGRLPTPESGPLSVGTRRVLAPCGWVDPTDPSDIQLVSGDHETDKLAEIGVRARGRGDAVADDPCHPAWEQARATDGDPVVVINANEADHRPRGDRTLLLGAPLTVLDGAAAVASHVDAEDVVIHLNEADEHVRTQVEKAVDGIRGELPVDIDGITGPDEYRAGAPTAALEALEGADRIEPRLQPPSPAEYGLYGRPTIVHTPRTVAQVRQTMLTPDQFDADADDPGTRLVTVTGDVTAPATVEIPTTGTLTTARDAVEVDGQFKMACVGGPLGGLTRNLQLSPSAPSLSAAGLGTDGVVELLTERRCPVALAGERARFAASENSGRCVPGREGTMQLTELLRDVYDGSFESGKIQELGRVMQRSANCQIGAHAPRPVLTAIEEFGSEFRAHADGDCPAGNCPVES